MARKEKQILAFFIWLYLLFFTGCGVYEITPAYVKKQYASDNKKEKLEAIMKAGVLAEPGREWAIDILHSALASEDKEIKLQAVDAIWSNEIQKEFEGELINQLDTDDGLVRGRVFFALGQMKEPGEETKNIYLHMLTDEASGARQAAVETVYLHRNEMDGISILLDNLRGEDDSTVITMYMSAFGWCGTEMVPYLGRLQKIKSDADKPKKIEIIYALKWLDEIPDEVIPILTPFLDDEDPDVAEAANHVLGDIENQ